VDQAQNVNKRDEIFNFIIEMLKDISADYDVGEISAETQLGSVVLESISLVYLIGDLQQHYQLQDLLLQRLRRAKVHIKCMRVADMVDLVCEVLPALSASAPRGQA
jgi:hypothetical protein